MGSFLDLNGSLGCGISISTFVRTVNYFFYWGLDSLLQDKLLLKGPAPRAFDHFFLQIFSKDLVFLRCANFKIRKTFPKFHPTVCKTFSNLKFSLNLLEKVQNQPTNHSVPDLKGQPHEIFAPSFFHQSVHSGPIRDVHGPFYFVLLFHRVIALLKWLPGTLEIGESQLPGTLDTRELWLPDLQSAGESPWVNFKAINLKFLQIVGHIVF